MNKFNKILVNVIIFFGIFLILNTVLKSCQTETPAVVDEKNPIVVTTKKNEYSRLELVKLEIKNNTAEKITLANDCPGEPFNVYRYENSEFIQKNITPKLDCENAKPIEIEPNSKTLITYDKWNYELFKEMGRYKIEFTQKIGEEEKIISSNEFTIVKEGVFKQLLYAAFYKPIYNLLAIIIAYIPGHDLGFAIILLTLIIRTLLLIPNNKAMLSQKKLSEIQPKIERIKEKYKGDQQKISLETMALWKESKVNPFGSCLPLLMQFPFLIALFYVIQGGLNPDNMHLLYTHYQGFDTGNIKTIFLGILDLTKPNIYVLPILIGGLQYIQLKLAAAKKTKKKDEKKSELETANNMMQYFMPVMIAVFTASMPAGVGLYWGISTTYGIVQQLYINKTKSTDSNEPTVHVIEKK